MTKLVVIPVVDGGSASGTSAINQNFDAIVDAIENTISRDGTLPNNMTGDIDLDDNDILNVNRIDTVSLYVDGVPIDEVVGIQGPVGPQGPAGTGDMDKSVYDPTNINASAFARANHTGTQAISTVTDLQTTLDEKAPIDSPTFTGTVSGVDKSMVGLGNVDNTSDANKPISTAVQNALDLKAPITSPSFTGTVSGIDKTMVGLGNVDNTSDATKLAAARLGTTTNDNAAAGNIGEYVEATLVSGSATALTTGTAKTIVSISLTAGDWDVSGTVYFSPAATTSITLFKAGISTTTDTDDNTPGHYAQRAFAAQVPNAGNSIVTPTVRISLAATTTIYLVANQVFTVSTMNGFGHICARRVR